MANTYHLCLIMRQVIFPLTTLGVDCDKRTSASLTMSLSVANYSHLNGKVLKVNNFNEN